MSKRCKDCENYRDDNRFGDYCIKRLHKKGCWGFGNANKCEWYQRVWWKFWRPK